jgi:hypothetical protein
MTLNKDILKTGLLDISGETKEQVVSKWNKALFDYVSEHSISGFRPVAAEDIGRWFIPSVNSSTFIDEFATNIEKWASTIIWSNGKDNKKLTKLPQQVNFKEFYANHKSDTDLNVYMDALSMLLHDYFSQFQSF